MSYLFMDHQRITGDHCHNLVIAIIYLCHRYYFVPWLVVYMISIIGLAILFIYLIIIYSAIFLILLEPMVIMLVLLPLIADIFLIYW